VGPGAPAATAWDRVRPRPTHRAAWLNHDGDLPVIEGTLIRVINALDAPVEAAWRELGDADRAAAAIPARIPLGAFAPDMVRLDTEVKQITHAIRLAAYYAEPALARALDGHYARAADTAYAAIREELADSGDICPGPGELLIRLDPLTAPRRTQALAALCDQLTAARARYPNTDLTLRYEVKPHPSPA